MRIEVIDNQGITTMAAELTAQCSRCTHARLATASLTKEALRVIDKTLSQKRNDLKLKLLVGLYNGHTEAGALRRLIDLQKRSGGSLEVRISKNPRFHWKVYAFESTRRMAAYVGSSNLTSDGLSAEGEVNIRLTGTSADRTFANIKDTFDRSWEKDSEPLSNAIADNFTPIAQQSQKMSLQIHPKIKNLLRRVRRVGWSTKAEPNVEAHTITFF